MALQVAQRSTVPTRSVCVGKALSAWARCCRLQLVSPCAWTAPLPTLRSSDSVRLARPLRALVDADHHQRARDLTDRRGRNLEHQLGAPDGHAEAAHAVGELAGAYAGDRDRLIARPLLRALRQADACRHLQQEGDEALH